MCVYIYIIHTHTHTHTHTQTHTHTHLHVVVRQESFRRGLRTLPAYAVVTYGTVCAFMVLKGSPV
jgi:hypothetical protein